MKEILSFGDLRALEDRIHAALMPHSLDSILRGLWNTATPIGKSAPFMIAGTVMFAVRFCAPAYRTMRVETPLTWSKLFPIVDMVTQFLLADPVGLDTSVSDSLLSILLRITGNQFPYSSDISGCQARSLLLYVDLPIELSGQKRVPAFDFAAAFERINGIKVQDFVDVGFVAFAAARSNRSFTRDYFEKARMQEMRLPSDKGVIAVLECLAADPGTFQALYAECRQRDRRFAAYDYNPLFPFPIIRPWRQKKHVAMAEDRLTVPLPELIPWRISTGIYYQMRDQYPAFTSYFGHLFEAYTGRVLHHSFPDKILLSEQDIRTAYPTSAGKAPDWIIVDGDTAILFECKATRFSRLALATGSDEAITSSLGQVKNGLQQLFEFIEACQTGRVHHQALQGCTNFCPVILTFESLYLSNSTIFRDYLDGMVNDKVKGMSWTILSVEDLEKLQPHFAANIPMADVLMKLRHELFSNVLRDVQQQTGCTYKDSFLYQKEQEIYERIAPTIRKNAS